MCWSNDIFLGLLALLFPPLPVWVRRGICSADSLINILLCCLGFIPGLIHAWYIIAKYPELEYEDYDQLPQRAEDGRVRYVYVQAPPQQGGGGRAPKPYHHSQQPQPQPQPQHQRQPQHQLQLQDQHQSHGLSNYGTVTASSSSAPPPAQGGEGGSNDTAVPPSYAEAVADHKIQTRD